MIRLYNTKTLQIEEFKPIHEGHVDMYVCGPTVYNYAHIGNARPMIVFDVLKRLFEAEGYSVTYVSNFTDVDDKIINRAKEEGITPQEVADKYIAAFREDVTALGVKPATRHPRVVEFMADIIRFVSDLILWKKTDMGIKWNSPWGEGRPGWHTECVVMINDNIGDCIDIHGGGMDLKFPHHENEAAQQEAMHGNTLANYWVHNAMVNIDGQKMSKSLGNTMWAKDVVLSLGTNLTRWLVSSVHYRKELNFSDETIETARKELDKVLTPLKQAYIKAALADYVMGDDYDKESYRAFLDCLDDDMNTPNAYAVIFETVKKLNQTLRQREIDFTQLTLYSNAVEKMLNVLGIVVDKPVIGETEKELFAKWNQAKADKDFDSADKYRNELAEKGLL